jgi:hypothetical protein
MSEPIKHKAVHRPQGDRDQLMRLLEVYVILKKRTGQVERVASIRSRLINLAANVVTGVRRSWSIRIIGPGLPLPFALSLGRNFAFGCLQQFGQIIPAFFGGC